MPDLLLHFNKPHTAEINSVAVSPDGNTLASVSNDTTVKLWSLPSGEPIATLTGHTRGVVSLSFFPDGKSLAVSDYDSIWVWDVTTAKVKLTIPAHTSWVYWVAVSPDGKTLLSTGNDFYIRLWDSEAGEKHFEWKGPRDAAECVAISPDGQMWAIVMGSSIGLWNAEQRLETLRLNGHRQRVKCVAFSPDGCTLASASYDKTVKLWDIETGSELHTCIGHKKRAWCVAFRPDGRLIASAGWDGTIRLWDTITGEERATLIGPHPKIYVHGVAFSQDGKTLAACGGQGDLGDLTLWDVSDLT